MSGEETLSLNPEHEKIGLYVVGCFIKANTGQRYMATNKSSLLINDNDQRMYHISCVNIKEVCCISKCSFTLRFDEIKTGIKDQDDIYSGHKAWWPFVYFLKELYWKGSEIYQIQMFNAIWHYLLFY